MIPTTETSIRGQNQCKEIRMVIQAIVSLQPKDKNPGYGRNHEWFFTLVRSYKVSFILKYILLKITQCRVMSFSLLYEWGKKINHKCKIPISKIQYLVELKGQHTAIKSDLLHFPTN